MTIVSDAVSKYNFGKINRNELEKKLTDFFEYLTFENEEVNIITNQLTELHEEIMRKEKIKYSATLNVKF